MKFYTFLFIFSFFAFLGSAQTHLISGKVVDANGTPINNASINQGATIYGTMSDKNGYFSFYLEERFDNWITISQEGYYPATYNFSYDKLDKLPSKFTLEQSTSASNKKAIRYKENRYIVSFQGEFFQINADQFAPSIGGENSFWLSNSNGSASLKLSAIINNFYFGAIYGYSPHIKSDNDSLNIKLNIVQYGLICGYAIVNSRRVVLAPNCGIKLFRYRLINSDKESSISLDKYVTEKELDLRLYQMIGYAGVDFSYRLTLPETITIIHNFGICASAGYAVKLNDVPWVYSKELKLTTDNKFTITNLCLSLGFNFIF